MNAMMPRAHDSSRDEPQTPIREVTSASKFPACAVRANELRCNCVKYTHSTPLQNGGFPGFRRAKFSPRSVRIMPGSLTLTVLFAIDRINNEATLNLIYDRSVRYLGDITQAKEATSKRVPWRVYGTHVSVQPGFFTF